MADQRENMSNNGSINCDDPKKAMGASDVICCILAGILSAVISFFVLFYSIKYSNVAMIVITAIVTAALALATALPFFGITLNINSPLLKGILVAVLVGIVAGYVASNIANIIQEGPGGAGSEPQAGETFQVESGQQSAESLPPVETPPGSMETPPGSMAVEDDPAASPIPTEIPSHADPITITPDPDPPTSAEPYVSRDFCALITDGNGAEMDVIVPMADEKAYWRPFLADRIRYLVDTDSQVNSVLINGDKEFTSLTSAANRVAEDIKSNGRSLEKQQKLIELRESAYELYPTYDLRKLLSDDYFSMAELCKGRPDEAYRCYLKSMEYELLAIRLCPANDNYYFIHLYKLATQLHAVGDIEKLGTDNKIEAYYLSTCLLEYIAVSSLPADYENMQADSCYYAGMVNHKLMNLVWGNDDPDSSYYFLDAYKYYSASLLSYDRDKSHKNSYLADLCVWAQGYIRKFGKADGMLSIGEYEQLHEEYAQRVLPVETESPADLG